eukprot:4545278-Pyramimonas_sp.AAC.1
MPHGAAGGASSMCGAARLAPCTASWTATPVSSTQRARPKGHIRARRTTVPRTSQIGCTQGSPTP